MSFGKCPRCNKSQFYPENCLCTEFEVWEKEEPADTESVWANSQEAAVEEFCDTYDSQYADYFIIEGGEVTIMARPTGSEDEPTAYAIEGKVERFYYATPV